MCLPVAFSSLPIVAIPIQDVQLLDFAIAHETLISASLSSSNATYGVTGSTDVDIYLGLIEEVGDYLKECKK